MTNFEYLSSNIYLMAKALMGCEYCAYSKRIDKNWDCTVLNDNSRSCADGHIHWLESEREEE